MNISFYGAAKEVTGSCYCLETNGKKILVDCGLQQGLDEKDNQKLPFNARDINFVILTHAHIDHSGRLPLLVKKGFNGKIYAIKATCDLISIMLRDSARIQEMDAMLENKKGKRAGRKEVFPLYSLSDVEDTLKYLVPCSYDEIYEISDGIKINFIDAGHILGSASVEIFLNEGVINKKIVFSGDIGNTNKPMIKDPQYIKEADYVVMESTYGDRNHEKSNDYAIDLANIINKTLSRGGNVIIPSFAVERTQELLYYMREIKERKLVPGNPHFPVYVDSPLASEATKIYDANLSIYADEQTLNLLKKGIDPLTFPNLIFTDSTDDSKAINYDPTPKVIISSSGMCDGGRVRHHLKHNLWRKECSVIFVGFQANGTLGRTILDGAKKVEIFGEEIAVLATIYNFTGLSAHADRDELLKWINNFNKKPEKVFVTHGEDSVCDKFVMSLTDLGFLAVAPIYKTTYDLRNGKLITPKVEIKKEYFNKNKARAISLAYANLLQSFNQLLEVISHYEGPKNKDLKYLEKLAREVMALSKKWDKF